MIYYWIFIIYFVNNVLSLKCKTSWPPNCIHNSTCNYNTTECSPLSTSSLIRGGTYCTTIIKKYNSNIIIGKMDCMYDQETTKICKNQTQCQMKYTNDLKLFLHCCCDYDYCNLNFTISNPNSTTTAPPEEPCNGLLCKSMYIIILCIIIGLITFLIIICFIFRKNLFQTFEICKRYFSNSSTTKLNPIEEKTKFLLENNEDLEHFIPYKELFIGKYLKGGRFSQIHQGIFNNINVAIKILITKDSNDEPNTLFEHEKQIYSLPFMDHNNILKYYGYSKCDNRLLLITELSEFGSLRDILRQRLLNDENELILIISEISQGLEYLHNEYESDNQLLYRPSIAHRDFKSENILYLNSNRLVICDFAMSTKIEQNQNQPNQIQQLGTPRYMSPELLAGTIGIERDALLKCDVYALGIVFWEILSRYPFKDCDEKYIQPFEEQLIKHNLNVNNPSVHEMQQIIELEYPFNRPLINPLWKNSNKSLINDLLILIEKCWDGTPETRISSSYVANYISKKISKIIL